MKKLLVLLLVLLGTMPLEVWQSGTTEQQMAFMERLADAYGQATQCKEGTLKAQTDGKDVYFSFECDKEPIKEQCL